MGWSTGASFFHPDYGLKVGKLADEVAALSPLMVDEVGQFWVYRSGVWRPDAKEVRRRVVRLLGERSRPPHTRAVVEVLESTLQEFIVEPVSDLINMRSGLLRWAGDPDPVLLEHHDACPSTVQLPVEWLPTATCPHFDAFLESAVPEDDRDRAWQVIGYLMMSGNPLQRLFLLTGGGGNGKGVFLNIVRALLGDDNFSAVPLRRFSETQFASAQLHGKLANVCGDIDAKFVEDTGRIKELAGDDKIDAERKGKDPFKFLFWGKAIFSANAIPGASDSSKGWTRRWEVINFPYEPRVVDPLLSKRIIDSELPGIAVKAVYALRQLMRDGGFRHGQAAETAHAEFAEKANRALRWINDPDSAVVRDSDTWNKGTILVQAFREWEENDSGDKNKHTGVQHINELLRQAGLRYAVKSGGQRGYYGLRIVGHVFVKERDKPWMNIVLRTDVHQSAPVALPSDDQMALDLG